MPIQGQLGFKSQSAWDTPVTVDTFHQGYLSDNPVREQPPIVSQGHRASRATAACMTTGARTVQGPFSLELLPHPLATLLTHMFGTVSTAGTAAPYTHTATPSTNDPVGFTAQVGILGHGTVFPFTYTGCRLTGWEISASAGEIANLSLDVVARDYGTATALASASYGTFCPFTFIHGAVTVNGTTVTDLNSVTLSSSIPRRVKHGVGGSLILEPRLNGRRTFEISADTDYRDNTIHNLANTVGTVVLDFDNGSQSFEITSRVFMVPTTPTTASGDGDNTFSFSGMAHGATDANAITAVLVNNESSAA